MSTRQPSARHDCFIFRLKTYKFNIINFYDFIQDQCNHFFAALLSVSVCVYVLHDYTKSCRYLLLLEELSKVLEYLSPRCSISVDAASLYFSSLTTCR